MSLSTSGRTAMAPRQSGLKKPRPLRSLSAQESSTTNTDDVQDMRTTKRFLSMENGETDRMSSGLATCQGLPVCKEIAAMSAQLMAYSGDSDDTSNTHVRSFTRQDSSESHSSLNENSATIGRQDSSASVDSAVFSSSTSSNNSRRASSNSISPLTIEPPGLYSKSQNSPLTPSVDYNSNNIGLFNKDVCADNLKPRQQFDRDVNSLEDNPLDGIGSGRGRYHRYKKSPLSPHMANDKGTTSNCSFMGPAKGIMMATLVTSKGDELVVTGRNVQTILLASRILLNELNASIVRMETVPDPDEEESGVADMVPSSHSSKEFSSYNGENESMSSQQLASEERSSHCKDALEEKSSQLLQYSKEELLRFSTSKLSRKPPSMWNVIASTHSDCCTLSNKVSKFFDPSNFRPHDGTFTVEQSRRERDRRLD